MIRPLVAALLAASLVAPAVAQSGTPPQPKRQTAPKTRDQSNRSDKLVERIAAALKLNEQQRQELIEIIRSHPGKGEQVRKLRREMLQAVAAKDDQRSSELREQMEQIANRSSNPMELILEELEPILSDRQAEHLRRLQNPGSQSGPQSSQVGPRDIERLREELELTDEQNRQFDEIVASASQTEPGAAQLQLKSIGRALQRARQEGNSERAAELEAQIRELGTAAVMRHCYRSLEVRQKAIPLLLRTRVRKKKLVCLLQSRKSWLKTVIFIRVPWQALKVSPKKPRPVYSVFIKCKRRVNCHSLRSM